MKKIIAISLFLIINALCFAQSSIRATGGIGFTFWNYLKEAENKALIGGSAELLYNYTFKKNFFVESGLHFNQKGNKYSMFLNFTTQTGETFPIYNTYLQTNNYLGIPVRFGYNFFEKNKIKLNVYLGSYLEYNLLAKEKMISDLEVYAGKIDFNGSRATNLNRFDIGMLTGVGVEYDLDKFVVFFRCEYQQGFIAVREFSSNAFDLGFVKKQPRNSTIFLRLGLGINLSKNKEK